MARRARPRPLDVAASALAHLVPGRLERHVDQLRLDARAIIDGFSGVRVRPFSTHESPAVAPIPLRAIDPIREVLPGALGARYEVLARDLRTVLRELRGDRLPATVARRSRARAPSPPPITNARRALTVTAIRHETRDAISIALRDASGAPISFVPGQFLTLFVTVAGVERRRAYSLSSAPSDDGDPTVTIKRVEGGVVSEHLHRTLHVGDTLHAAGPTGSFVAPPAALPRHLVLFAGGSGITPILSLVRSTLSAEPGSRVTLVYGNRDASDVIFARVLEELAVAHADRLRVVHLHDRHDAASEAMGARAGRPDRDTVVALVSELALHARLPGEEAPLFFVCGPATMMDAVRGALSSAGIADAQIREERFLSPPDARPTAEVSTTPRSVSVRSTRALRTFTVAPGQTILEAAMRAGTALPSSCTMGGCAACRCRVVEGEVDVEEPNCLSPAERDAGFVLTCVGRPKSDVILELP